MDFKYSKLIKNEAEPKAEMLLFGAIGEKIDGDAFASELNFIYNNLKINNIDVLINTVGGNVFQGYSIASVIDLINYKGGNVRTINVGIAYSMGGIILAVGKTRITKDYGNAMIHDPSFGGKTEGLTEQQKQVLEKNKESLITILSNNLQMDCDKVRSLMEKETYLSSKEMKKIGLVDEIETTGKSIDNSLSNIEKMAACADLFNNKQSIKTVKKMNLNSILKLNPEASEHAQVEAVNDLIAKASKVKTLSDQLDVEKAKTVTLENRVKELEKEQTRSKAESLVDKAIEEAKLDKEARELWIVDAMEDYERTEKKISLLSAKPASINAQLDDAGEGKVTDQETKLAEEYGKILEDNPSALDDMDGAKLEAMQKAYDKLNTVQTEKIS